MSSAKPTPRYVERIPAPNIHLVGGTAEAQVIPIRRITPAYVPTIDAPARPSATPGRAKRFVPVDSRPWLVMLVPPMPGARTRNFGVTRWQAQLAVVVLATSLVFAGGAVAALVGAIEDPQLFGTSQLEILRERLEVVEDSLTLARAELATDHEAVGDSLFNVLPGMPIPMPVEAAPPGSVGERLATRKAPRPRTENGVALSPRSTENLPVVGRLASGFSRSRRHPVLRIRRPHLGVDVAAPRGTPVTAPAPGKVTFVGRKFGFGLVVEMDHGSGVRTRYAHLTASMVKAGDEVAKDTFIATVGSTGITTGPHLHYEILVKGRQVDPLRFRLPQAGEAESTVVGEPPAGEAVVEPSAGPAAEPPAAVVPGSGTIDAPATSHEIPPAAPSSAEPR
jgi:murein DD-endopeptidase MepM/ murein hydrolase activator NlpD